MFWLFQSLGQKYRLLQLCKTPELWTVAIWYLQGSGRNKSLYNGRIYRFVWAKYLSSVSNLLKSDELIPFLISWFFFPQVLPDIGLCAVIKSLDCENFHTLLRAITMPFVAFVRFCLCTFQSCLWCFICTIWKFLSGITSFST